MLSQPWEMVEVVLVMVMVVMVVVVCLCVTEKRGQKMTGTWYYQPPPGTASLNLQQGRNPRALSCVLDGG